jgi:hypothetical protein
MRHFTLTWAYALIVFTWLSTGRASAQLPPEGASSPILIIDGKRLACSSHGQTVLWRAEYNLNDGGHTSPDFRVISYNPRIISVWPVALQLWGMGHECGHAYNRDPDELRADCWSITTGVRQGWFGPDDFDDLKQFFADNKGDIYHPPGDVRVAKMKECMDRASVQSPSSGTASAEVDDASEAAPSGESQGDWQNRFEGNKEASNCVQVNPHIYEIKWRGGNGYASRTVHYHLGYKNNCDRPLICKIRVGVGNGPKHEHNFDDWEVTDQKLALLPIPVHGSASVQWRLDWDEHGPKGTASYIRMSSSKEDQGGDWGMSCVFTLRH